MRSLVLLATLLSVCLSVWISNRGHWEAVRVLRQRGDIEIVFSREQPSFVDRILGDWRFDNVSEIVASESASQVPKVSAELVGALRGLEKFSFDEIDVTREANNDISCLELHLNTLKFLDMGYTKSQPPLLAKFTRLEELVTNIPIDFSQLKSRSTLRSVSLDLLGSDNEYAIRELACLKNLRRLSVNGNGESAVDVGWLVDAGLKLDSLSLSKMQVDNTSALTNILQLRGLSFVSCEFDLAPPLAKLPLLNFIQLYDSGATDLEWVRKCVSLKCLVLEFGLRGSPGLSPLKPGPSQPDYQIDLQVLESLTDLEVCVLPNAKADYVIAPKFEKLRYAFFRLSDSKLQKLLEANPSLQQLTKGNRKEASTFCEALYAK